MGSVMRRRLFDRQGNGNGCAVADRVGHYDSTAVRIDDPSASGQPQTGARNPGRIERFKNLFAVVHGNPRTVIADQYRDRGPPIHFVLAVTDFNA